jgi:predicted  nucleic acid-binding Zn-ribbon protein
VNADLEPLIELQTLDLRINELSDQQRKIPAHLEAAEVPLREAKIKLDQAKKSLEISLKERRDRERDLEVQEAQVEKFRARLTELKTNKEYQAALFEIEMANKRKRDIEDGILTLMETVEKWQAQVKDGERLLQETEGAFQAKKQELDATQTSLTTELAQLGEHQKAKMVGISKGLLDRYRKLKAGKKDLALVPVRNGICSGCRLQLPPQLVAEVKRGDALQSCSYCQRILFYEGDPGAQTGPAAESPSLAATGKSSD